MTLGVVDGFWTLLQASSLVISVMSLGEILPVSRTMQSVERERSMPERASEKNS